MRIGTSMNLLARQLRAFTRTCLRGAAAAAFLAAVGCTDMMVERAAPNLEKASVDRSAVKVDSIDIDPIMRGTVASETGLGHADVAVALAALEMDGLVARDPGGVFRAVRRQGNGGSP